MGPTTDVWRILGSVPRAGESRLDFPLLGVSGEKPEPPDYWLGMFRGCDRPHGTVQQVRVGRAPKPCFFLWVVTLRGRLCAPCDLAMLVFLLEHGVLGFL